MVVPMVNTERISNTHLAMMAGVEISTELNKAISHPFPRPSTGPIALKIINHLADEVKKVSGV